MKVFSEFIVSAAWYGTKETVGDKNKLNKISSTVITSVT